MRNMVLVSWTARARVLAAILFLYPIGVSRSVAGQRSPLPLVLAGQSNALLMRPYLEEAYKPGEVIGFAQDGSRIDEWSISGPYWKALTPALHRPVRAFVWWQGESDFRNPRPYLAALRAFIDRVRREANDPNLPVLICRVVDDPTSGWSDIRHAQEELVSHDSHAVLVSSDGLPKEHPEWPRGSAHLSPEGYRAMARRVVAALR